MAVSHRGLMAIALAGLLGAACSEPMGQHQQVARNCSHAAEGERLFRKYAPVLVVARDWEKVGWIRQVPITKWMACRHQLASHAPIDDCLDQASYDPKRQNVAMATTIEQCIAAAKRKLAQ